MNNSQKPTPSRGLLQRMMRSSPSSQASPIGSSLPVGAGKPRSTVVAHQPQSFAKRQEIDKNRQLVQGYSSSQLGTQYIRRFGAEISRGKRDEYEAIDRGGERIKTGQNRPSAGFKEPPARHNPYA